MALSTHIRDREKNRFRASHDGTTGAISSAGIAVTGNTPGSTVATTTSGAILAANTSRGWAMLTNVGNNDVYIALGQTAVVDAGIVLTAKGGTLMIDHNRYTQEAINGITQTGNSRVIYQETERPDGL